MEIEYVPKDINNIWISYLTSNEVLYYTNRWNKIDKNKLCDIAVEKWMV